MKENKIKENSRWPMVYLCVRGPSCLILVIVVQRLINIFISKCLDNAILLNICDGLGMVLGSPLAPALPLLARLPAPSMLATAAAHHHLTPL